MNYGFLAIVAIFVLGIITLAIVEHRQEKNDKKMYIPRDYERKMRRLNTARDKSRRQCQRPLILKQGRDGKWSW